MNIKKCLENIIETYKMMKLNNFIIIILLIAFSICRNSSIESPVLSKATKSESDKLYKKASQLIWQKPTT